MMRVGISNKRQTPYQFVLDELLPIRPSIRQAFGYTYIYLDERLLLSLRESVKQPQYNGVWLYTQPEHIDSLRREFPLLPKRCFWKSKQSGWVICASRLEEFEEYAFKVCELILRGDRRIGRVTRSGAGRTASNRAL
jgi:hypothetical protein